MPTPLTAGYNVVINQRLANGTDKPIYPYTRMANVFDLDGRDLKTILTTDYEPKGNGNYVPDYSSETVSNLRFLRNDNTWANIQEASTSQAGVVTLYDALDASSDVSKALTAKQGYELNQAITAANTAAAKAAWIGAATNASTGVQGIAPLDTEGIIPTAYLPSYVSDVFEVRLEKEAGGDVYTKAYNSAGSQVTPKANAIYVYSIGDGKDNNTYRWSGSQFVEISKSLAIGTTAGTAYDGAAGAANAAWIAAHNNVENKSSADIRAELTATDVKTALGLDTSDNVVMANATHDGIMSKEYAAKLDNCKEIAVSSTSPTFASTEGIWFQVKSDDSAA